VLNTESQIKQKVRTIRVSEPFRALLQIAWLCRKDFVQPPIPFFINTSVVLLSFPFYYHANTNTHYISRIPARQIGDMDQLPTNIC